MPPAPKRNNAQHQPLTTVLRNIIREYPAGGGVLRELCQNADDAGATKIEFVLDRRIHVEDNILDTGLAPFQGPALLAFNDSEFAESDFDSLSRIGDSGKVTDLNSTGKFGRGFNSVYNWTDTPSIISGENLLILDPHFTWSRKFSPESPGGPRWDFVESIKEFPEMRNQLSAFGSIMKDFDNKFEGTIIRIPLRTEEQAKESKIVPGQATTEEDIIEVFSKFTKELVESLLFLRNIHTIILRVDDGIYAKAVSTTGASHQKAKEIINKGYQEVFVKQEKDLCETDFLTDISLSRGDSKDDYKSQTRENFQYVISHHLRKAADDEELQKWARGQKLFPWIAIAAPLKGCKDFTGRLFSTLPLPIHTKHPVHIHGMFSITPDRSNIHSGGDWTMSDNSETKLGATWNTWLFQECIPHAWIRNLQFLDTMNNCGEADFAGWNFWPAGIQGEQMGQLWMGILSILFQWVVQNNLKLLPTVCGRTGTRKNILFTLETPNNIKNALQDAGSPVIIPPADRKSELDRLEIDTLKLTRLTPETARVSLSRLGDSLKNLSLESRQTLLEYVLSDKDYESLGFCHAPLLPISGDKFCGFSHSDTKLYFPTTSKEAELFKKSTRMIDTKKLTASITDQIKRDIVELDQKTAISIWKLPDAVSYCEKFIFNTVESQSEGKISISDLEFRKFVDQFWGWIDLANNKTQLSKSPRLLDGLWLIPTIGDHYYKISEEKSSIIDVSSGRFFGHFIHETARSHIERDGTEYPIYTGEGFSDATTRVLRVRHYIEDCEIIGPLMDWLVANSKTFVDRLNNDEKAKILEYLGSQARTLERLQTSPDIASMRKVCKLSLFRHATPTHSADRPWISLDPVRDGRPVEYIGIKYTRVELRARDTIFIDINQDTEKLVSNLGLMRCPSRDQVIKDFVIPSIVAETDPSLRASLVDFTLYNFEFLSEESKLILSKTKIVPVDNAVETYRCPTDTVSADLAVYFFLDEHRVPLPSFPSRYLPALATLGMATKMNQGLILERITAYNTTSRPVEEIRAKAEKLITMHPPPSNLPQEYLKYRWIPASFKEEDGLYTAIECRDPGDKNLVKYAMPLTKFSVSEEWKVVLGWKNPLSAEQILRQLKGATEAKDSRALRHLITSGEVNLSECNSSFREERWVPDTGGIYHRPCDTFLQDVPYISPYFGTLSSDLKRSEKAKKFLITMGMNDMPSFTQLKELQDRLAVKGSLDEDDLGVALFIVKEVGRRFANENLEDFKAPDNKRSLLLLKDLTAGEPGPGEEDRPILHQGISPETIKQLCFATFKDRHLESLIDSEFDFSQKESPSTAIADTLKRYAPTTTFSEYLANAEDCGSATKIAWILDKTESYDRKGLLSPELGKVQGPALFCYNDGEFSNRDFRAIIDIGVGSKRDDASKIGRFGRGALTMYHWTSVPSFISGDSFVIFDPEERYLPQNPATRKRRAGLKLNLKDVRNKYPDQLLPFEGICGFDRETTFFKGTIFRFPFRSSASKSVLSSKNPGPSETYQQLVSYYTDAIDSLLFLEKINKISFLEKYSTKPIWEVSSVKEPTSHSKIKSLIINARCTTEENESFQATKEWCVISGKKSEDDLPTNSLVKIQMSDRLEARYGLAALISREGEFHGRNYMSLPLRKSGRMEVPVHVDANLVIQSNRQSIPLEDSEMEEGSEWNKWIFEKGVAPLYLTLVKYLMQTHGTDGYHYWPPYPSELTDNVSRIISTAFWERLISSPYELYPPVTPLSPPEPNPRTIETPSKLDFKRAVFDLLEPTHSDFIIPLLLQFGRHNIVSPPQRIRNNFIACNPESIVLLSPSYFLELIRTTAYNNKLLEIWRANENDIEFFNTLLLFITSDTMPESIKGCALLPLQDNSLGTFRLKTVTDNYLVAQTPMEQEILDIAPSLSVHHGIESSVLEILMVKDDLNIKHFQFEDIARLYKTMNRQEGEYRKKWLEKVWSYYESCIRLHPENQTSYLDVLNDLEVYCGTPVGLPNADTVFISPTQFSGGSLAAILQQAGQGSETSFLQSFQGLILLDVSTFPQIQVPQELIKDVTGAQGLNRLLRSIHILATQLGLSVEEYIIKTLDHDGIETLRRLLEPTTMTILLKNQPQSKTYLEKLPIWPSESGELSSYRPATKAMLAPDIDIPFTGILENDPFIKASIANDYSSNLQTLGVKKMAIDELLENSVRPGQSIENNKMQRYKSFLKTLYGRHPPAFSKHPLAIDGNRNHCMSKSLYDLKDRFFRAAFRDCQKTHFLHPLLRELDIWSNVGLRKEMNESYYLECVKSIERRRAESPTVETDQLVLDAQTVFEHLTFDARDMGSWAPETWALLNDTSVPVKTKLGACPSHRVPEMRRILENSSFAKFRRAIIEEYESISWSQCPILQATPGRIVLANISSKGIPSPTIVLKHLAFLSKNRYKVEQHQIQAYVKDIEAVYRYLQERTSEIPIKDRKAEIWFNVEAEDVQSMTISTFLGAWKCSEDLCMNKKHDSGSVQSVLTFLVPFAKLLDHYGVEKVIPPVPLSETLEFEDHSQLMLLAFQKFRREGKFIDVFLEVEGQILGAHRVILAAATVYFEKMFTLGFRESTEWTIPLPGLEAKTVNAILNYIYSGEVPEIDKYANPEVTYHDLIYQLEVSDLWRLDDLKAKIGDQLSQDEFIRPETVIDILDSAKRHHVYRLESVCNQYIKDNQKIVQRETQGENS